MDDDLKNLVTLAERLARHLNRSEATISNWIVGHARLFKALRSGGGCTVYTARRCLRWFVDHWPEDLVWPADIPRPAKSKKDAA